MEIDKIIDSFFQPISEISNAIVFYSIPLVEGQDLKLILFWLAAAAIFFTFYLGFANIRYVCHAIKLLSTDGMKKKHDGEISQFQALMASLSGTVGLGNISGVAIAISLGGPGAVFWMTLMGFFGMSSKFAEVLLGVKYRIHPDPDHPEKVSGGPMYYLKEAFARYNMKGVGIFMANLFCACCILGVLGGGNMYQANQAFEQLVVATGGQESALASYGWAFGLILAALVGIVIFGGLKSIANVASKLVPLMAGIYILAGLIIIALNFSSLPAAFVTIIKSAFSFEAGIGGFLGGFLIGVQRAAFSNEAGLGTAAIMQSTTNTDGPVGTGLVAMLGPVIDTIIICNITALVIVLTGVYESTEGLTGVTLTSNAFNSVIPNFDYVLTVAVFLFAYSTMISWYYYGAISFRYLFGEKDKIENIFKILFCVCTVIGSAAKLTNIIDFSDAASLSLAITNILALFMMAPEIKQDLKEYIEKLKQEKQTVAE
ncbi:MAG: amino acid carrier protein [Alphaproteobacteria bacterium]|nr:amino acid carrier protein [Alphaproteobacteria bacterium]